MVDPNISYPAMKQTLLEKYGVKPGSKMQFYRAKRKVQQTTKGVHVVSYNDLPPWIVAVENENKGSIVKLNVELKSIAKGATGGEAIPIDPNIVAVATTHFVQAENTDPNSTCG
ncbi:hypothetical protein JHK82_025132 [Glycine max]|nr:hypothetical protein JHK82_025132 [Glycine max]